MDFVKIGNVCTKKVVIKAAKRIFNSDKICRNYCDFYFGVTFSEHSVVFIEYDEVLNVSNRKADTLKFEYNIG